MTKQRTFKRRVRERMAKTGESYTAARRRLIASGDLPDPPSAGFEPLTSEQAVVEGTGRGWQEWFALLDDWGAGARSHREIARWLADEREVASWWSQSIAVSYERVRGLRAPGERPDGFAVGVTRTVGVAVERLYAELVDDDRRERWLPGAELRLRTATAPKSARYDWEDGSTRLVVAFDAAGDSKSRVSISHERLPDADTADGMKTWWRERLDALRASLEGEA
jgi:uncharacterized protein YndB with AHSA1/START domain